MKEKFAEYLEHLPDILIWLTMPLGVGVLFGGLICLSDFNAEIDWRLHFEGLNVKSENSLNRMRIVVKNQKIIKDEYVDSFLKVVQSQSSGREGGDRFKFAIESAALGIDKETFLNLSNTISIEMNNFNKIQNDLIDAWKQHNYICLSFPSNIFLSGKVIDAPKIISSQSAKDSVKSKEMEEIVF